MAYDEKLATRIRAVFEGDPRIAERKMFGGLCFTLNGHMCCGIVRDTLMLRVGAEGYDKAVSLPHARPMDFTGKPMKGMVYVDPAGFRTAPSLLKWIKLGSDFTGALPPKTAKHDARPTKAKPAKAKPAKAKPTKAKPQPTKAKPAKSPHATKA
ncbi:MAG: TfoX/Sxy family protein [Polyangiaceae bacterium]|nr:TfoX/Sxy family protein [Myxococcales bacterium]MCB9587548.1 TfoX/Sxy family protein [Polyangiaceae bacterium]MCB9605655.1 TfoX/Sxy family protein [Polyangiaceae bacterium]